jgi:hypothetical protein
LLNESSSPGQTAQEEILSSAGFEFTINIGRKNQGYGMIKERGRRLSPERTGNQE